MTENKEVRWVTKVAVAQPFKKNEKQEAGLKSGTIGNHTGSGKFRIDIYKPKRTSLKMPLKASKRG